MAGKGAAVAGALKSAGSAVGSKAVAAGGALKSAAGALGGAGVAASAGSSGATGAVWGAGAAAGASAVGALKNASVILLIAGFLQMILRSITGGSSSINFVIAFVLLFVSGYAIATQAGKSKAGVYFPIVVFLVWYYLFGANLDKVFLIYFGTACAIILAILMGLTRGRAARAVFLGFVPPVIFFVDIGLISWLVSEFNLQMSGTLLNSLILYTPWWALLGLFLLPTEEGGKGNTIVSVLRVLAIVYLVFVLIVPAMPMSAYESIIPSTEELTQAEADFRAQAPKTENPGWSNFICTIQAIQNVADIGGFDVDECVAERQLNSQIKYTCEDVYGFEVGSSDYERCLEDEKTRIEEEEEEIAQGTVDRSILEKTEANFKIDRNTFPTQRVLSAGTAQALQYPINLEIENPREQLLGISLSCNFSKDDDSESFLGQILPTSELDFVEKSDTISRTCAPPNGRELNGSYTLTYLAEFTNLETTSYLTRMFLEDYDEDNELIQEAERTYFFGSNSVSSAPEEFARINFGFGEPETNPLIEKEDAILLVSSIENVGNGEITRIDSYSIELEPYLYPASYQENEFTCLYGDQSSFYGDSLGRSDSIPLSICFLELSSEMLNLIENQDFVVQSFEARLLYDYKISTQNSITVTLV